jgi:hypothetical protein
LRPKKPVRRGTVCAMTRRTFGAYCFMVTGVGARAEQYGKYDLLSLVCSRKTNDEDGVEQTWIKRDLGKSMATYA